MKTGWQSLYGRARTFFEAEPLSPSLSGVAREPSPRFTGVALRPGVIRNRYRRQVFNGGWSWPADIDFLPAWRHAYKLRPLQLIGAFTFERHVINCRLEEKTRDGNRARLSGPDFIYTFPRASSRNQWPEPLTSPMENGNYYLSTVLPSINNKDDSFVFRNFDLPFSVEMSE